MGSSSASLFAVDTSLSLGMRVDGSMLGQQHESGRHGALPLMSASNKVPKKPYSCKFCPRKFKCPRALGGHQKAHRDLRDALYWRSSAYAASLHRACLDVQRFNAWRIHYSRPLARSVQPSFPWQTGGVLHDYNEEQSADGIDLTLKL